MILQVLSEAAIPLIGGIILTAKLFKDKQNKIFYLGPILLLFAFILIIKPVVTNAEQDTLSSSIANKLKGSYKFPVEVDMFTILKDIKASSSTEISYYYTVSLEDLSTMAKKGILDYACKNNNYKNIYKNGYVISFIYQDTKGKEIAKIITNKDVCDLAK